MTDLTDKKELDFGRVCDKVFVEINMIAIIIQV